MSGDSVWAPLARSSRTALALLGYEVGPACLPGEPESCGASYELHALACLASLAAVVDHHLEHLGGLDTPMVQSIYTTAAAQVRERCGKAAP